MLKKKVINFEQDFVFFFFFFPHELAATLPLLYRMDLAFWETLETLAMTIFSTGKRLPWLNSL